MEEIQPQEKLEKLKMATVSKPTTKTLIRYKEIWIGQLRYKKVKLEKMIERGRRIMDNDIFENDQINFYRRIEKNNKYEGKTPEVDKFINFWSGIWQNDVYGTVDGRGEGGTEG